MRAVVSTDSNSGYDFQPRFTTPLIKCQTMDVDKVPCFVSSFNKLSGLGWSYSDGSSSLPEPRRSRWLAEPELVEGPMFSANL